MSYFAHQPSTRGSALPDPQMGKKYEEEVNYVRKLQKELSKLQENQKSLYEKKTENELVKKEFGLLETESSIYKLVGPVLVKVEQGEATQNVDKRLEYIEEELSRVNKMMKEMETKLIEKQKTLQEMQATLMKFMQAQQQAQKA
mmetsp:Transcript_29023/g.33196  ORF Transcript_29023/g.33196 Transcript_29023/m.33196 type:complete len:144 (-) Transcript_29023:194-625(-)